MISFINCKGCLIVNNFHLGLVFKSHKVTIVLSEWLTKLDSDILEEDSKN